MKFLLIVGLIGLMFMSTFAINMLVTTVQAWPPCDNDLKKPCFTVPPDWIKGKVCPDCPGPLSVLDLIRLVEDGNGDDRMVNVALTHGPNADILTIVLQKNFSMQNSSMMDMQNSSMMDMQNSSMMDMQNSSMMDMQNSSMMAP